MSRVSPALIALPFVVLLPLAADTAPAGGASRASIPAGSATAPAGPVASAAPAASAGPVAAVTGRPGTAPSDAAAPAAPTAPEAPAAGPKRIMIAGDSMSQGSVGDFTWRYRLWNHLSIAPDAVDFVGSRKTLWEPGNPKGSMAYADGAFDPDHEAVAGQRAAQRKKSIRREVARLRPDVVCLLMGINDLVGSGRTPHQSVNDLREVIRGARQGRPDVKIIVGRVQPRYDFGRRSYQDVQVAAQMNRLISSLPSTMPSPRSPLRVAATDQGWDARRHTWDGLHPNPTGEVLIAAAFADQLATFGIGPRYQTRDAVTWPGRPATLTASSTATVPAAAGTPTVRTSGGAVQIRWRAATNATGYLLWARTAEGIDPVLMGMVTNTTYSPSRLPPAPAYQFAVTPVSDKGRNRLTWSPVAGANAYTVHRRDLGPRTPGGTAPASAAPGSPHPGPWIKLASASSHPRLEDFPPRPEHIYEYRVRAAKGVMFGESSPLVTAVTRKIGPDSRWSDLVPVPPPAPPPPPPPPPPPLPGRHPGAPSVGPPSVGPPSVGPPSVGPPQGPVRPGG